MKRKFLLLSAILLSLLLSASRCKKDNNPDLPPETTSGANTFGCKVNGKVFVPRDGNGRPGLFCQYVNLGEVEGGGWHLNIPAINWKGDDGASITTDSLFVEEGKIYDFKNKKGYPQAFYSRLGRYSKLDSDGGRLSITKHDKLNRILSGTFFFIGTNTAGEKMNITEGRFDIRY